MLTAKDFAVGAFHITNDGVFPIHPNDGKHFQLKELQEYVGGLIEYVWLPGKRVMVVNEEATLLKLPENKLATRFFWELWESQQPSQTLPYDRIFGNVVLASYKRKQVVEDLGKSPSTTTAAKIIARPKTADEWVAEGQAFDPQVHFTYTTDDRELVETLVRPYWAYVVAYCLYHPFGPFSYSLEMQFPDQHKKEMLEVLNRYQAIPVSMSPKKRRAVLAKIIAENNSNRVLMKWENEGELGEAILNDANESEHQ